MAACGAKGRDRLRQRSRPYLLRVPLFWFLFLQVVLSAGVCAWVRRHYVLLPRPRWHVAPVPGATWCADLSQMQLRMSSTGYCEPYALAEHVYRAAIYSDLEFMYSRPYQIWPTEADIEAAREEWKERRLVILFDADLVARIRSRTCTVDDYRKLGIEVR